MKNIYLKIIVYILTYHKAMNKGKDRENSQPSELGAGVNQIVRFDLSQNEEIFTEEQKENIIGMFPENIRKYLYDLKNPLDQTEVILSILKDKNIKIILKKIINEFEEEEKDPLFCASDFARMIKSAEKNINRWKKWLVKEDYVVYNEIKNGLLTKGGDGFLNLNTIIGDPQNKGDGILNLNTTIGDL